MMYVQQLGSPHKKKKALKIFRKKTHIGETMKGQGSTEYLVILAVVLVVALIVVGLLGQFTGFGKQAKIQQSRNYWSGAQPFSILEAKLSSTGGELLIKNQQMDTLFLKRIDVKTPGGVSYTVYDGNERFVAGEQKPIGLNANVSKICSGPGEVYDLEVTITYKSGDVDGIKQVGQENLYGVCV